MRNTKENTYEGRSPLCWLGKNVLILKLARQVFLAAPRRNLVLDSHDQTRFSLMQSQLHQDAMPRARWGRGAMSSFRWDLRMRY